MSLSLRAQPLPPPFSIVRTVDQWLRCAHTATALDVEEGVVELATAAGGAGTTDDAGAGTAPAGPAAGLAFDRRCRLYRSIPEAGRVESLLWRPGVASGGGEPPAVVDLFAAPAAASGDFVDADGAGPLADPRGLAVTGDDDLYVAEAGRNRVLVHDLPGQKLIAVVRLADEAAPGPRPIDLAVRAGRVLVLTASPARILEIDAHGVRGEIALPAGTVAPARLAASPGGRLALLDPAAGRIFLVGETPARSIACDTHATDVEFDGEDIAVVARWRGQDFVRRALDGGPEPVRARLRARGYDGRGIVRLPDGRIGFPTDGGQLRAAVPERRRFASEGTVTTFRLDSGDWQTSWGRLFVDACTPEGSEVRVHTAAIDEPPDEDLLPRTKPVNAGTIDPPFPEQSPPMPPLSLQPAGDGDFLPLHRRDLDGGIPWAVEAASDPGRPDRKDRFVTLEAPVQALPEDGGRRPTPLMRGRYLWVTLQLLGDGRVTPRVRSVRAEHRAHESLRRLPKVYSRNAGMESFLHRYLAPLAGLLGDLDGKADARSALLDPCATPDAALPWLGSFMGLVLDERWARAPRAGGKTIDVRRQLIAEANCLFRLRGTVPGLRRFIEIYAGVPVVILEQFRVRGLGGAPLGARGSFAASSVVGAGLRVGGGGLSETAIGNTTSADAFRTHAHRFSVIVPAVLDDEGQSVVRHILEVHRPAHTLFEICTIGSGPRLGMGMHLALSSYVGQSARFESARLGGTVLGTGVVLGRPSAGAPLGTSALDGEAWLS